MGPLVSRQVTHGGGGGVWLCLPFSVSCSYPSLEGVSGPQAPGGHLPSPSTPPPPLWLAELSTMRRGGWGRHNSDSDRDNIRSEKDQLSPSS